MLEGPAQYTPRRPLSRGPLCGSVLRTTSDVQAISGCGPHPRPPKLGGVGSLCLGAFCERRQEASYPQDFVVDATNLVFTEVQTELAQVT